jgi:putative NADH-flavin reductase
MPKPINGEDDERDNFGATGSVGRHLVDQALNDGHKVTAFARAPSVLAVTHANLAQCTGDVLDPAAVQAAVAGHDAVIVALGAGRSGTVRATGTRNIVAAMRHHGVRRMICASTLGAGDSYAALNFIWKRIMFGLLLRDAFSDHQAQEDVIRQSDLDWVIVRPGAYTDGPETGVYKSGFAATEKDLALKISRADVARFMIQQLTVSTWLRQTPGLSY